MASIERMIRCRYLRVHDGKRENAECSVVERCDCFELIMDQVQDLAHLPGPEKTLRLPKSLFHLVSNGQEHSVLHFLLPIEVDENQPPNGQAFPPGLVDSGQEEALPAAARYEPGEQVAGWEHSPAGQEDELTAPYLN